MLELFKTDNQGLGMASKLQVAYKIEGACSLVFKEAIINALSHRDYYEQGATITIEMFDDRVSFYVSFSTRDDSPLIFVYIMMIKASGIPRGSTITRISYGRDVDGYIQKRYEYQE